MTRSIPVPLVPQWMRWLGVLFVAAAIFYLSIITVPPEQVAPKPDFVPLDKWRHFLAYAAFGFSIAYALVDREFDRWTKALTVFVIALFYGVGIEVGQSFLPYRYFGIGDAIANAIGATLSLVWFPIEGRLRFIPIRI